MELQEGKEKFIESWGKMASEWGINRTMAQVHALLLVAPDPLTADDIIEELNISRGNSNMTLRALMEWGLVHKQLRSGERREYFFAEKDMWVVVRQIIINRKKRELDPMLKVLDELSEVKGDTPELKAFSGAITDIKMLSHRANEALETLIKSDSNWFTSILLRLLK
jgi:DNA-binding transcriptional regulator GbsR (MarR family)